MKTLLFFIAFAGVSITTIIADDNTLGKERFNLYSRYLKMADPKGVLHTIDLEAEPEPLALDEAKNQANNVYYLYTRKNRLIPQKLKINNTESVHKSNFAINKPTYVLIHDWLGDRDAEPSKSVRPALLNVEDSNVFSMDYSSLASKSYYMAANGVPAVGRALGQFMIFLNNLGVSYSNMHLIGYGMGAHVAGNAGRETGGNIARITGLDPSGPGFNDNSDRLTDDGDAVYVECIHTGGIISGAAGGLGSPSAVCNADFYPNGGSSMPVCLTANCDHQMAPKYFAATISNRNLFGKGCANLSQVTGNTCDGIRLEMGNQLMNKSGTGIYRVTTGKSYPFSEILTFVKPLENAILSFNL